jgi:adenosylmethionine-8-amino-7-oxononanoate aminotransferase
VACAASLASLDLHEETESLSQVRRIHARMKHHLDALADHPSVEHHRLIGGIAAFDLVTGETSYSAGAGRKLASFAQEHGILLRPLGNVLYLMPPYCTSDEQIDRAFGVIGTFLKGADSGSHDVA